MVIMMVLIPGSDFSSLLSQDLLFFLQFQKLLVRKREDKLCCCFMRDTMTPELSAWLGKYDIIPSGYIVYVFSGRSLLLWLFLLLLSSSRGASGSKPWDRKITALLSGKCKHGDFEEKHRGSKISLKFSLFIYT